MILNSKGMRALMVGAAIAVLGAAPATLAQESFLDGLADQKQTIAVPSPWPMANLVRPGTLTVGITAQTPPGSFTTTSGEFDGSRIKLFRKIAGDLGLEVEFVRMDWPGILPGLAANRFDIACEGASWNPDRLRSKDFFLTRPVNVSATVGIVLKDSGITSWDDVAGKRLAGVKGENEYNTTKELVNPGSTLDMPGKPEAIRAVLNKQADVFSVDVVSAQTLIEKSGEADRLTMIGPALNVGVQSLCVNKNSPDLLSAVNLLLTNYRVDGTLSAFENEYTGTDQHVLLLGILGY